MAVSRSSLPCITSTKRRVQDGCKHHLALRQHATMTKDNNTENDTGVRLRRYECDGCDVELYAVFCSGDVRACPSCGEPTIEYDGVADRVMQA